MEKSKDQQKKALVFEILDEMKKSGERINADKVAKQAQMGKQTILPYYNEWRFLSDAQKQDGGELPADLVRSLQRIMIQWKNEMADELTHYKKESEQAAERLEETIRAIRDENDRIKQQSSELAHDNERLTEALRESRRALSDNEQEIKESRLRLESREEVIAGMKERESQMKDEQIAALQVQEEKLDQQHKQQIDHWMKVLDEERQQKQQALRECQSLQTELLARDKEKGSLENQLEQKSQAYIAACEERNDLRKALKNNKPELEVFGRVKLLVAAEGDTLVDRVRAILLTEQQYEKTVENVAKKDQELKQVKKKLALASEHEQSIQSLKMELEKSKGYAMALEKSLDKLHKAGQK